MRAKKWDSLFLEFPDAQAEQLWTQLHNSGQMSMDAFALLCYVFIVSVASLVNFEGAAPLTITALCYTVMAEHVALLVLLTKKPVVYRQWRFPILTFHKGLVMVMGLSAMSLSRAAPTATWLQFLAHDFLLMNKLMLVCMAALAFNLKWSQHIIAQSLMVAISLQGNASMCRRFFGRTPGNMLKYSQVTLALDRLFMVDVFFSRFQSTDSPDICKQCRRIQAFFQVALGFIFPCLFLYQLEARSRVKFLHMHADEPLPEPDKLVERMTGWVLHTAQVFLLLSMLWAGTGYITGSW